MPAVGELKVGVGEYMKIDYKRKKKPHENAYILAGKRQEARALVSGKKGEKAVVYGHGGSEKSREDL